MSSVGTKIRFLPSLSRRFGGPVLLEDGRLKSELRLQPTSSGTTLPSVSKQLVLRGPADVLSMQPGAIARVEPPPGCADFEPNYFPFVEFVDPDLPWRYSLDDDTTPERRRPWLVLLVLSGPERQRLEQEDNLQVVAPVENGRELLRITGDLLPELDRAWGLAHVHLNRYDGEPLAEFIEGRPEQHCSRLLCCRRLEAKTRYFAFLVPLYEAGKSALKPEATPSVAFAWQATGRAELVELPIYYRWEFMTSEQGDFESLARELAPASVSGLPIGRRAVDAALMREPGAVGPPIHFEREGSLAVPGFEQARPSYAIASEPLPLTNRLRESLNESLSIDVDDDEQDPLITFPVYGSLHRKIDEVKPPEAGEWPVPSPWAHELNQDFQIEPAQV